jgi:hypothetical protein
MKIQRPSFSKIGRLAGVLGVISVLTLAPKARAGNIDLYDFAISSNGTVTGDWQDLATSDPTLIIDNTSSIYNDTNCCGDASGGTTTGLGTVNYTFTGGAIGTYDVSLYYDFDVSTPYFNEYGLINGAGSAESGVVGEIFNASSTSGNIVLFPACGTANCEVYGSTNGTNSVPGTTSNYFANCVANNPGSPGACNADVGMALTFTFTTTAVDQNVLISAVSSTTNPGGFSLETIHPADSNNAAASQVYLTGTYTLESSGPPPPPPGTPEPSTWILAGCALIGLGVVRRSRNKACV